MGHVFQKGKASLVMMARRVVKRCTTGEGQGEGSITMLPLLLSLVSAVHPKGFTKIDQLPGHHDW